MATDSSFGSDIVWDVLGSSAGTLLLNAAEIISFFLALVFVVVGSLRLQKNANATGTRYILAAIGGLIIGFLIYTIYLLLIEHDGSHVIEAVVGLYTSLCAALGAYGFLRLSRSLSRKERN